MSTTPKGAPYPEVSDTNNAPARIQALAEWVDARPGVATFTTEQRNVLVGGDIWPGRVIFNSTTGAIEINKPGTAGAANWTPLADSAHVHAAGDINAGTLAIARLPVAASGTSSATAVVRADDSRLSDQRVPTDGSVSAGKLAASAVTTPKLADLAVTGAKVADAAIATAKIVDAAVTTAKVNDGAITGPKLAAGVAVKPRDIQTLNASGNWNKPAGATRVRVILIGGGGRGATAEINAKGGAGGAVLDIEIPASYLAAVVPVTVAAGGTNSNAGVGAGTYLALVSNVVLRAQSGAGGGAAPAAAQALVDVTALPQPMGLPGGVPTGESADGQPAPGGGVGGFNPVDTPAYAPGAGAFGLRPPGAAGDVTNAIAAGGGAAPGGGGLGGNPGTNGQPGAACLISYFD